MALFTTILNLLKKNPATDGNDTFNIQTMLNDNWDKVDAAFGLKAVNADVRVATTANLTLSGLQVVDGVTLVAGDRVLVKNQSTGSQNGIYAAAAGAWVRAADADTTAKLLSGVSVYIKEGTANGKTVWRLSNTGAITLGTTALTFQLMDVVPDAAATANTVILRDANGRAQVAAPSAAADIARKDTVDAHANLTSTAHGAVSAPTASTLMARDASGRAQVAAPSAAADIARKDTVDAVQTNLTNHIGAGGTAHANAVASGAAGFMSGSDKAKLDGIAAGATNYVHPTGDGNQHIPATGTTNNTKVLKAGATAGSAAWGAVDFSEVGGKPTTLAGYGITDAAPSTHVGSGGAAHSNAIASGAAGFMSGADKAIVDAVSQRGGPYGATAGTGAAYTVTAAPALTALADGAMVVVKWHTDNTGACTINVNGLGAKAIKKGNGNDPAAATLKANAIATLRFSSTANAGAGAFILQGEGGSGNAVAGDLRAGKTAETDAGPIVGTLAERQGDTAAISSVVAGTTLKLLASAGIRDGVDDYVTITDADFIATNILSGKDIFGLVGTLVKGKATAQGTHTGSSQAQGVTTTYTITGLAFTPSTVIVARNDMPSSVYGLRSANNMNFGQTNSGADYYDNIIFAVGQFSFQYAQGSTSGSFIPITRWLAYE